jgi:hypothetical protein
MGYRSDVKVVFYVERPYLGSSVQMNKALAMFDLWYESVKGVIDRENDHTKNKNSVLCEFYDVKWYPDYEDVKEFEECMRSFVEDYVENNSLDAGSGLHAYFNCEFMRVGENYEDVEVRTWGDGGALSLSREITVDLPTCDMSHTTQGDVK